MFPASTKIILVDGDASIRRALGRIFSAAGFAWEAFASGEEFLAAGDECGAACVVADTRLPGLDGLGLMRRFAAGHPGVPFIFLSVEEDEETRREARAAGAAAFFRKPIDAEALLDSIRWTLHAPAPAASA
jgi:FixJ family two-component response regulator